jgi:hypothetical protein
MHYQQNCHCYKHRSKSHDKRPVTRRIKLTVENRILYQEMSRTMNQGLAALHLFLKQNISLLRRSSLSSTSLCRPCASSVVAPGARRRNRRRNARQVGDVRRDAAGSTYNAIGGAVKDTIEAGL